MCYRGFSGCKTFYIKSLNEWPWEVKVLRKWWRGCDWGKRVEGRLHRTDQPTVIGGSSVGVRYCRFWGKGTTALQGQSVKILNISIQNIFSLSRWEEDITEVQNRNDVKNCKKPSMAVQVEKKRSDETSGIFWTLAIRMCKSFDEATNRMPQVCSRRSLYLN